MSDNIIAAPVGANAPTYIVHKETSQVIGLNGLTLEDAEQLVTKSGRHIRIISEDGVSCCVTAEWVPERINLELESNIVISAYIG